MMGVMQIQANSPDALALVFRASRCVRIQDTRDVQQIDGISPDFQAIVAGLSPDLQASAYRLPSDLQALVVRLPRNVDRTKAAEIVRQYFFEMSPRSFKPTVWPLTTRYLNRRAMFPTIEVVLLAHAKLGAAPTTMASRNPATRKRAA